MKISFTHLFSAHTDGINGVKWIGIIVLICLQFHLHAQSTVTGLVLSGDDNQPLPGVSIQVQGTTSGTVTDTNGRYSIAVRPDDVLVFSYVGFVSQEILVGTRSVIDVSLATDQQLIDEIVVIGYGAQRERDVTSAITTVKSDEIAKTPTSQAMQSLQGRVSGVQIVSSGAPGSGPTVRVRGVGSVLGSSNPLYVVDGMFFDDIDFLSTSDIATISVLKDASAKAIFGVRAANGVVLIETKNGNYNQPTQITYDGYYGVQVAQNVIKMANAEQFTNYALSTGSSADADFIDNAFLRYGRSRVNPNIPDVNTDWYDEVLKTGPIQNHSISIDGGSNQTRFSIGTSYFSQQGLLRVTENNYERLNFRTRLDFAANEWLTVGANLNVSSATQFNADNSIWFKTYFAVPIIPVFDEQNTSASPLQLANAENLGYRNSQNPFFDMYYNNNRSSITKLLANFYLDFSILPNKLSFRTAYNSSFSSIAVREVDFPFNDGVTDFTSDSDVRKERNLYFNQISDNILTFNESFGNHNLTLMGGYSYRSETFDQLFVTGTDIEPGLDPGSEEYWYINNGVVDIDRTDDAGRKEYGISYYGRAAYNYSDRYLLYTTYRRDGTNKFQKRWGNFVTFGAGWVISEENFFPLGFVDFLKLRGSWGKLGNDNVPAAVGTATLTNVDNAIDDELVQGTVADVNFSYLGEWETSAETNFGISSLFLNERLSLEADYFVRNTENAALIIILPLVRDQVNRNVGEIRNTGLELALNWSDNLTNNISYSIGGNIATLKNEMTSLGGQPYLDAGTAEFRQRHIVGQPISAFFGYEVEGVFQSTEQIDASGLTAAHILDNSIEPGDFRYKDQNNDGVIDDQDRVVIGSYLPKLTYGANIGLTYGNLNVSANLQGQAGHSILNRKRGEVIFTTDTNIDADLADNLWDGEGSSNKYPSAAALRKPYNQAMSEYFVESGSYFRIQNVRLSYTLRDTEILGGTLPQTRITFTAERPLTVFNYNGFNPEVPDGIDRQTYPIPAVYTIGLNVSL